MKRKYLAAGAWLIALGVACSYSYAVNPYANKFFSPTPRVFFNAISAILVFALAKALLQELFDYLYDNQHILYCESDPLYLPGEWEG